MRFRVEVRSKMVAIVFSGGSYRANFERNEVEYSRGEFWMHAPDISMEVEFDESHLLPKEGFDGVMHYFDSINIDELDYRVDIEYLDTTAGEIPLHKHPAGVEEVYVTVDEPFCGEVCLDGRSHRPWAKHMIAVKILPK